MSEEVVKKLLVLLRETYKRYYSPEQNLTFQTRIETKKAHFFFYADKTLMFRKGESLGSSKKLNWGWLNPMFVPFAFNLLESGGVVLSSEMLVLSKRPVQPAFVIRFNGKYWSVKFRPVILKEGFRIIKSVVVGVRGEIGLTKSDVMKCGLQDDVEFDTFPMLEIGFTRGRMKIDYSYIKRYKGVKVYELKREELVELFFRLLLCKNRHKLNNIYAWWE